MGILAFATLILLFWSAAIVGIGAWTYVAVNIGPIADNSPKPKDFPHELSPGSELPTGRASDSGLPPAKQETGSTQKDTGN